MLVNLVLVLLVLDRWHPGEKYDNGEFWQLGQALDPETHTTEALL